MWRASIAMSRRLESTENRPIVRLESLEHCGRPGGIVGNRQIVEELKVIEAEARQTDKALKEILEKIGV